MAEFRPAAEVAAELGQRSVWGYGPPMSREQRQARRAAKAALAAEKRAVRRNRSREIPSGQVGDGKR